MYFNLDNIPIFLSSLKNLKRGIKINSFATKSIDANLDIQKGIYVGVTGPTLETPAEYNYFRNMLLRSYLSSITTTFSLRFSI